MWLWVSGIKYECLAKKMAIPSDRYEIQSHRIKSLLGVGDFT